MKTDIIKKWNDFKMEVLGNKTNILNRGLTAEEETRFRELINEPIPKELLLILRDANGQKSNTSPIFMSFSTTLNGTNHTYYRFLPFEEIVEYHRYIRTFARESISKQYIPFAGIGFDSYNSQYYHGVVTFAINSIDYGIYKINCLDNYQKYNPTEERYLQKFADNFIDFIDNQILWKEL